MRHSLRHKHLLTGGNLIQSVLSQLTYQDSSGKTWLNKNVEAVISPKLGSGNTLTAFIDALKQDGLVKVLAEPNLICLSGKSASFLAGGEIPFPSPRRWAPWPSIQALRRGRLNTPRCSKAGASACW